MLAWYQADFAGLTNVLLERSSFLCSVPAHLLRSCPTLYNPMDCNPQGSPVHGILQARILEWVAMPSSRGSSWPRNRIHISCIADRFSTHWATWETLKNTGVGCQGLLQGIFLTQGSKPSLISPALAGSFFATSTAWVGNLLYKDAPFLMEALHRLPGQPCPSDDSEVHRGCRLWGTPLSQKELMMKLLLGKVPLWKL